MSNPNREAAAQLSVAVQITRTGGIAGLRREWNADAPADEAPRWVALIDECPWDDPSTPADEGRDRFVWCIRARTPVSEREAELPDHAVTGPWRDLVDEVRRVAASGAPTEPAPGASSGDAG